MPEINRLRPDFPNKSDNNLARNGRSDSISAIICAHCPFFTHFLLRMSIRLIVGLGNPGPEYEQTRHNAGFWLVDQFPVSLQRDKNFNALVGKTRIGGSEVWLLEPQTYMNRSGQSVGALCRFYKINP